MKRNRKAKIKKPFYKKWWFVLIAVLVIIAMVPTDDSKDAPITETDLIATDPILDEEIDKSEENIVEDEISSSEESKTDTSEQTQNETQPIKNSSSPSENFIVHYIDVGQAEAVYINYEDIDIVIDGGNNNDEQLMVDYLKNQNVDDIEYLIATHSHEDHIGGLDAIINAFEIETIILSPDPNTTKTYSDFIDAVNNSNALVIDDVTAIYYFNDYFYLETFECGDDYSNHNNQSVITKLTFYDTTFLFTGDAEKEVEDVLVSEFASKLDSDVFLAGHHGSNTSNTNSFLDLITPNLIIISAGLDNSYGHPHDEIIERFYGYTDNVYCTIENGTIIVKSDGTNIFNSASIKYSLNTNTSTNTDTTDIVTPEVIDPSSNSLSIKALNKIAEYIIIQNTSSSNINMTGWWVLSVQGGQIFNFPNNYIINSNSEVMIGGYESKSIVDLIWEEGRGIWSNDKDDPAELYDSTGNLIDTY